MRTTIEMVKAIIKEINEDDALKACKSFSELHNHCDANCLGETGAKYFIDIDACPKAWQKHIEILNEAQSIVSFYLSLVPSDRILWLNQIDNHYFNAALIRRIQDAFLASGVISIASEIADLNLAIHEHRNLLLEAGLVKEIEEGKSNPKK